MSSIVLTSMLFIFEVWLVALNATKGKEFNLLILSDKIQTGIEAE